jgi:hypothetical protein
MRLMGYDRGKPQDILFNIFFRKENEGHMIIE